MHKRMTMSREILSIVLSAAMVIPICSPAFLALTWQRGKTAEAATVLSNPRIDVDGVSTWDCVYFGSYWQNDTNGDGVADQKDEKQPIKWRVLAADENDAFLLADCGLDCKPYNTYHTDVTWETCTLRSWLNGYDSDSNTYGIDFSSDNFIDAAFSQAEQSAIRSIGVANDGNSYYGMDGGNDTTDKIYLLSIDEVSKPSYGFESEYEIDSDTRITVNTAYAKEQGAFSDTEYNSLGSGWWWLRSPGNGSAMAADVQYSGYGDSESVSMTDVVVRPVLHLNLKAASDDISSALYFYAGTVSSNGEVAEKPAPAITSKPSTPAAVLSNPHIDTEGVSTWDCVWFGSYWQNDTNGDGVADRKDEKEPIKWRVLSVDGADAFLMADCSLDCKPYNTSKTEVTWETCTLRSWLNGYDSDSNAYGVDYRSDNFIDAAFSQAEQSAVRCIDVANDDNPYSETEGGNNTMDKIYLLSIAEASTLSYGFASDFLTNTNSRIVVNSAYAKEQGGYTSTDYNRLGSGWWWLRSPGYSGNYVAANVYFGGDGTDGSNVINGGVVIRPVLHLDISSNRWFYAGTISSNGEVAEKPLPSATSKPSPSAPSTPTRSPSVSSTQTPKPQVPSQTPKLSTPSPTPAMNKLTVENLRVSTKKVKKSGYLYTPQITVTWKENTNCNGYVLWRRKGVTSNYKLLKEIEDSNIHTFIDRDVQRGISYTYKVVAYRTDKTGGNIVQGEESMTKAVIVNAKLSTPSFTVKKKKKRLIVDFIVAEGKQFQSQYRYNGEKKWHPVPRMQGKIKKRVIKKLVATGFKIRIRTYEKIDKKKVYSKWSKAKAIR